MVASVSAQCRACITTLKTIISTLSDPSRQKGRIYHKQVIDELERFSLWMGNIGTLHRPESSMSLESRLREASDVLTHILELLDDLKVAAQELWEIVSEEREGGIAFESRDNDGEEGENEETLLVEEIGTCVTRLFRVSSLIRQAAPKDIFAKALSRNRYRFNDQFDIAHVGEKYPKLATEELAWLRKRLGQAITQRRHYLSYIQDHREKLEGEFIHDETPELVARDSKTPTEQNPAMNIQHDFSSRPSTFFTRASSLTPGLIPTQILTAEEESDPENDAKSYASTSRSFDGDLDSSAIIKIPKLDELRLGSKKEVECPFCFRVKRFKSERNWRRHVLSDLRCYVCTFPECDAPYFGDINEWFRHEMQNHRIIYSCQFCQNKSFRLKDRYLVHVQKEHPDVLEVGGEQPVLDIARKPLNQIPAHECPFCSEWVDRMKKREAVTNKLYETSNFILTVEPSIFKQHVASHLEQLALFAIPIGSAEDNANSNAAIEENTSAPSKGSEASILAFDSSRPSSIASKGRSSNDSLVAEEALNTKVNQNEGREDTANQWVWTDKLAESHMVSGQVKDAVALLEEVVAAHKTTLKETHPDQLASQHQLGRAYLANGQAEEAVVLLEHVVKVRESMLEETHLDRLTSQQELARAYMATGRTENAVALLEHVVNVREATFEEVDLDRLSSQEELARAYIANGQDERAVALLEHVVKVHEATLQETHLYRLGLQKELAGVYMLNGQTERVVPLLEHIVKVHEAMLEGTHPDRLAFQEGLGRAYVANGQAGKAVVLLEHVVKVRETMLEETHFDRLASQQELARAYMATRQTKNAVALLEHVVKVREATLEESDLERLWSQEELARAYIANGQTREVVPLLERIVKVREAMLEESHPNQLWSQNELGRAYLANGQTEKAVKLLEHVVKVREVTLQGTHPDGLWSQKELARAYLANGQARKAVPLLEHVVNVREATLEENHPARLWSQRELSRAYVANGQAEKAVSLLEHVVKVHEAMLEETQPDLLALQQELALAYESNEEMEKAIALLEQVVKVREATLEESHPDRLASQHELARAYESLELRETAMKGEFPAAKSAVARKNKYIEPTPKFRKFDVVHTSSIERGDRRKGIFKVARSRLSKKGDFFEYQLEDGVGQPFKNGAWIREKELRLEKSSSETR